MRLELLDEQLQAPLREIYMAVTAIENENRLLAWAKVVPVFAIVIGLAVSALADNRVNKVVPIEPVSSVAFSGAAQLVIIQGEQERLEVSAPVDLLNKINVEQAGSRLLLGRKSSKSFWRWLSADDDDSNVTFTLTVKSISELYVAGAGHVHMGALNGESFKLELTGAAQMNMGEVSVDRLTANLTGASRCAITRLSAQATAFQLVGASQVVLEGGGTVDFRVESVGASRLQAAEFKAVNAKVHAVGASQAVVSASEELTASATGASRISYTGKPKTIKTDTAGASNITML